MQSCGFNMNMKCKHNAPMELSDKKFAIPLQCYSWLADSYNDDCISLPNCFMLICFIKQGHVIRIRYNFDNWQCPCTIQGYFWVRFRFRAFHKTLEVKFLWEKEIYGWWFWGFLGHMRTEFHINSNWFGLGEFPLRVRSETAFAHRNCKRTIALKFFT